MSIRTRPIHGPAALLAADSPADRAAALAGPMHALVQAATADGVRVEVLPRADGFGRRHAALWRDGHGYRVVLDTHGPDTVGVTVRHTTGTVDANATAETTAATVLRIIADLSARDM